MSRTRNAPATRRRHRKWLRRAKGYWGAKSKLYTVARESVQKSLQYAYRDRRKRKGEFRRLWITRINAACRINDLSYSRFMSGLKRAQVELDRKMLAELAVHHPQTFASLVELARTQTAPSQ
jgi:large subunit ribosomal protein L20